MAAVIRQFPEFAERCGRYSRGVLGFEAVECQMSQLPLSRAAWAKLGAILLFAATCLPHLGQKYIRFCFASAGLQFKQGDAQKTNAPKKDSPARFNFREVL
jgi:hypothetical protein